MSYELSYNTHETFLYSQFINLLQEEATITQNNVKTWLFDSDLSSSVVLPASLRESFEECAIQLHHYTPQDEIDKGTICLFANKMYLEKLNLEFERLREIM
ncbi:hypothetical protein Glove_184g82 [Diversispora epigaea]|uniref:Uncharacterized protein n=1 Tax=Diversispora epigaea TaxID=1348612 RepID=A0A397IWD3_9GLOM|nr:hypothetical protein Glove_184g82 [Diversispora epigaea]